MATNPSVTSHSTYRLYNRTFSVRSYGCQTRPKDIPGFQCHELTETESRYTGVHFKEDYAFVRSKIPIPQFPKKTIHKRPLNFVWIANEDTVKMQNVGMTSAAPADEEEKYAGPLLHGSAPEMIVSSGALGMTNTKRKVQVNYQPSRKRSAEELAFDDEFNYNDVDNIGTSSIATLGPPKTKRVTWPHRMSARQEKVVTVRDYMRGEFALNTVISSQLTNLHGPSIHYTPPEFGDFTSPDFVVPSSAVESSSTVINPSIDTMDESINRVVENSVNEVYGIYTEPKRQPVYEEPIYHVNQSMNEEMFSIERVEPEPEISGKEKIEKEKALLRYKEIGRRICELELSDFAPDKTRNDRKTFMIATRGEEILASVKRNLGIIKEKLGEYAEGTIFNHVEELTDSFAYVSPNALNRLNELVAEKLKRKAERIAEEAAAAALKETGPSTSDPMLEVKSEPPEYLGFEHNYS